MRNVCQRSTFNSKLLCTVIKLHVVKEAIQSSSSLPFITNFNLFVKPSLQ